ncbi:MAG: 2-amino-4-hydroxy-6-hydroxymethyldihydropteridine diphosphokinase [Rhizobiaceae bacterium]|nr:2-amino-4-hydroxy-6-hydroxymethyldihydropteridine diphosphokinase [Rhizobiaceae bacterium]
MSQTLPDRDSKSSEVFLGLGGNIGNVLENMAHALQYLDSASSIRVIDVSGVYKTPPWGVTDQDWFLNCCASIETTLAPTELLEKCLEIEIKLKRKRVVRWGPRSVDIDILVFGDLELETENLKIPHPRMLERSFVMLPLAEISPMLRVKEKTAMELRRELHDPDITKVDVGPDWWRAGSVSD